MRKSGRLEQASIRRFVGGVAAALVALVMIAPPLWAADDTSTLSGTVTVEGNGLPNVSVTARDEERGTGASGQTDASGAYRIPLLRPGVYIISAEMQGFAPYRATNYRLLLGQESVLNIELKPTLGEKMEIVGQVPIIDPTTSQLATSITPEQVENLPMATRNYLELALLAPGTKSSRDPAFSGVVSAGTQEARNSYVSIDGADNNNFILGGQIAAISPDSIQEFQVITTNFSAEYGRSNSAIVNVLTKSGTNELSGSAYYYYRDEDLQDEGFFNLPEAPFKRENLGLTLGGPIARDRAFFFLSYDDLDQNQPIQVVIPARPELSESVPVTTERQLFFAKGDLEISANQRLTLSYRLDETEDANKFVGGGFARSYGYAQITKTNGLILEHQWVASPALYNQLRFSGYDLQQDSIPNSTAVGVRFPTFSIGQNFRFPQGGTEERVGIADTIGWSLPGEHFLKLGIDYSDWTSDTFFALFSGGQFQLASDNPLDPRSVYIVGIGDPTTSNDIKFYSAFVQDEWRPVNRLTLNLGLRWDYHDGANNSDYVSPYPFLTPSEEESDHFQPRLGFAYDLSGDAKLVIRGGGGLFYHQLYNNLSLNEDIFNGVNFRIGVFPCARIPGGCNVNSPPSPVGGVTPPPEVRANAEDLTTPYTTMYNLGVASEAFGGWALSADGVYIRGYHELAEIRENLRVDPTNAGSPRPNPSVGSVRRVHSTGSSEYWALQTSARRVFLQKAQVQVSYTLSEATNDTEFFAIAVSDSRAADPLALDEGPARNDQRHRLVANGSYMLPWDFTIASILTYGSGQPYNVRLGVDANLDDSPDADRPPGFSRNSERSDDYLRLDFRVDKRFQFGPVALDLIGEAFNLTNHENFDPGSYSNVVSALDFGEPRPSANPMYQPRQYQLAARVSF